MFHLLNVLSENTLCVPLMGELFYKFQYDLLIDNLFKSFIYL